MWVYSKNATQNQPWTEGNKHLQLLVPIVQALRKESALASSQEESKQISLFDNADFCCWNLDRLVRKKKQPHNSRKGTPFSSMDIGFGIVNSQKKSSSNLDSRFLLVELKLNAKTYKNITLKSIQKKIDGTRRYLFEINNFHSEYYMVCDTRLVQEFISEFSREMEGESSESDYNFTVIPIDLQTLYNQYFNSTSQNH